MKVSVTKAMRAELDALYARRGTLKPAEVVKASKNPSSALHPLFLWDNPDKAADLWRLERANDVIVSIRLTKREAEEIHCSVELRRYHGMGDGYKSIENIMGSSQLRAHLLERALQELQSMEQRYRVLRELAEVFDAASNVRARAQKKKGARAARKR